MKRRSFLKLLSASPVAGLLSQGFWRKRLEEIAPSSLVGTSRIYLVPIDLHKNMDLAAKRDFVSRIAKLAGVADHEIIFRHSTDKRLRDGSYVPYQQ